MHESTKRGNRQWAPWAVLAAVLLAGGGALVFALTTSAPDTGTQRPFLVQPNTLRDTTAPLAAAHSACGEPGTLTDQDRTLLLDTSVDTIEDVACVLVELDAPHAVSAQMDATRALDGMQSANWDGFEATWNYHPDTGMNLIITSTNS